MKVAIYSGTIPSTTFIENLLCGIANKNIQVFIFGTKTKKVLYESSNIKVHATPNSKVAIVFFVIWNMCLSIVTRFKIFYKLYRYMRAKDYTYNIRLWAKYLPVINNLPDIFHVQWAKSVGEWGFLKDLYGVKLIVSFRGAHINYSPICEPEIADLYRTYFPHYDAYHCVSKAILNNGCLYGARKEKAAIIYPAVRSDLLNNIKTATSSDTLRILSVGRDHWVKGYPVALDACKILKDSGVNFHYTIIAGGEKEEIKYHVFDNKLEDHVTLLDNLPHDQVIDYFNQSDLFLLPSLDEGVANVVLEAMALGIPVISTICGGMDEVINNNINGWLVPCRDPEALANAIEHFTSLDDKMVNKITTAAKETIRNKHLIDLQISSMINLYNKVAHE